PADASPTGIARALWRCPDHRIVHAMRVVGDLGRGATLAADGAALRMLAVRLQRADLGPLERDDRRAAHTAEGAVRLHDGLGSGSNGHRRRCIVPRYRRAIV